MRKQPKTEPEGVQCACGEFTAFTVYALAHWRDRLNFNCPKCGKAYSILQGRATPRAKPKGEPR